jgi:hypothetical protein
MNKKVIAFDLGLSFGYCGGKTVHGCIRVSDKKRMFSFYDSVMDLMVTKRKGKMYDAIVYESWVPKGNAIYNYNGQKAILQLVAESLNIELVGISVQRIKSYMLGKGHGLSGPDSKKAIRDKLNNNGWDVTNLNESDAIAIYHTHLRL